MKNLLRRIERLEKRAGGDFQTKLRLLAAKMDGAEQLIKVASQYQTELSNEIGDNGSITWVGFRGLYELGAFEQGSGA